MSRKNVLDQLRDEVRWQRDPDAVAAMHEMDRSIRRTVTRAALLTGVLFGTLLLAIKVFG